MICGAAVSGGETTWRSHDWQKYSGECADVPLNSKSCWDTSFRSWVTEPTSPSEQAFQRADSMVFRRAADQEITEKSARLACCARTTWATLTSDVLEDRGA